MSPPLRAALGALASTLLLALLLCLSPLRWDVKALGPTWPRLVGGGPAPGTSLLFVSADTSGPNGHVAAYGLDLAAFPKGRTAWVVFAEGFQENEWRPDALLDAAGTFEVRAAGGWRAVVGVPEPLRRIVAEGTSMIVVPSREVAERLRARSKGLDATRAALLDPRRLSLLEAPAWRVDAGLLLRLLLLTFVLLGGGLWLWEAPASAPALRWFHASLAFPIFLAGHSALVFLLGFATSASIAVALELEAVLVFVALWRRPVTQTERAVAPIRGLATALAFLALLQTTGAVLRLDFDGDLFTHWLPMARSHYLLGHHDVAALADRYGIAHQSTYPPGFPILISTLLWTAGADPAASFAPGPATHAAVFLYRLFFTGLALAFLVGLAGVFRAIHDGNGFGWLLPPTAVALLLPVFLGQPMSGEVAFVPLMGFALLALLAGAALDRPAYSRLGVGLALAGLFFKNDAALVLPLLVLPWYLEGRPLGRRLTGDFGVALVVLVPVLLWRLEVYGLGARTNFMFDPVSLARLREGLPLLPRLAENAVKILLASNFWTILVAVLPVAAVLEARRQGPVRLLAPLGIALYVPLATGVYIFSRSDPLHHMDTSYPRLLMVAVLSAILFVVLALLGRGPRARLDPNQNRPSTG